MEKVEQYKQDFMSGQKAKVETLTSLPFVVPSDISPRIVDLHVSMHDFVNSVLAKSERPIVVVYDDYIEYINKAFLKMLGIADAQEVLGKKFLNFVSRDDWDFIAENIGDILTSNGSIELKMLMADYKVRKAVFDTLFLEDDQHFTFMLLGRLSNNKVPVSEVIYDDVVGLPKFQLFEVLTQHALNYENYKSKNLPRNKIAVCCIAIKNYAALKNDGQIDFVMHRIAEKLLLTLNKLYTVAVSNKYQFWILMPDMQDDALLTELAEIQTLVNEPVMNKFVRNDVSTAIGVSIYPDTAQSSKKVISQAEMAAKKAMRKNADDIVIFGN